MSEEKKEKNKITLEEHFANIEQIIAQMEGRDVTLDRSFDLYKSGMEEVRAANSMLDSIEKAMLVLNGEELEEF